MSEYKLFEGNYADYLGFLCAAWA